MVVWSLTLLNYVMQEHRLIICSSHPSIIEARGRKIASIAFVEWCVQQLRLQGRPVGHDGLGNDSLLSPHNQSPILIYVYSCPFVCSSVPPTIRRSVHPTILRCRYLLSAGLFTLANLL